MKNKEFYKNEIEKLEKELNLKCDFNYQDITSYDNSYLCDVIHEICDSNVYIYNNDLLEWAKDNYSYIDLAIEEFGNPNDFIKSIQYGQYYCFEEQFNKNLSDILKYFAYNYLIDSEIDLNVEKLEELEQFIESIDIDNLLSDISDKIEGLK